MDEKKLRQEAASLRPTSLAAGIAVKLAELEAKLDEIAEKIEQIEHGLGNGGPHSPGLRTQVALLAQTVETHKWGIRALFVALAGALAAYIFK